MDVNVMIHNGRQCDISILKHLNVQDRDARTYVCSSKYKKKSVRQMAEDLE